MATAEEKRKAVAASDRPQRLPKAQRHRAIIQQAQKLATYRDHSAWRLAQNYLAACCPFIAPIATA
jgi:hypothetical protein